MIANLFVGYRTRLAAHVETLMPEFHAPSNWKDKDKIAIYIEDLKANFLREAKTFPYVGTFDCVCVIDSGSGEVLKFEYRDPRAGEPPVCVRVRDHLLGTYPDGWSEEDYNPRSPPFRVIGFEPRRFLKMLGLECSLPSINKPLPLRMWYSNHEYRSIEEAILPPDFEKMLTLAQVLKCRRPPDEKAAKAWDDLLRDWQGPGVSPEKDARLSRELALQLGF